MTSIFFIVFMMMFLVFAGILLMEVSRIRQLMEHKKPITEIKKILKKK